MTDEQIAYMKQCLAVGLAIWYCNENGMHEVISIGLEPTPNEPCEVVYLEMNKIGFSYAALAACKTCDFIITTQDLAKWPK